MNELEEQIRKLIREEYETLNEISKLEQKRIDLRLKRWKLIDQKEKDNYENRN
jgi:hypothetical protein